MSAKEAFGNPQQTEGWPTVLTSVLTSGGRGASVPGMLGGVGMGVSEVVLEGKTPQEGVGDLLLARDWWSTRRCPAVSGWGQWGGG